MNTPQATPDESINVNVLLADGSEVIAYWKDGAWWVGIDSNPEDQLLTAEVVSWRNV